jgi:hypothetical protein
MYIFPSQLQAITKKQRNESSEAGMDRLNQIALIADEIVGIMVIMSVRCRDDNKKRRYNKHK